jgi:hypothetical protein
MDIWDEIERMKRQIDPPVWELLAAEGNFELIGTLRHVEQGTQGFGTIAVPREGFSENDITHNAVLDWLRLRGVQTVNPSLEETRMERALEDGRRRPFITIMTGGNQR